MTDPHLVVTPIDAWGRTGATVRACQDELSGGSSSCAAAPGHDRPAHPAGLALALALALWAVVRRRGSERVASPASYRAADEGGCAP